MSLRELWQRLKGTAAEIEDPAGVPSLDDAQRRVLEGKLGHAFSDPTLLDNALLHRSHAFVVKHRREDSNERLEFLGDAVLGLIVNDHLFQQYPEASEGDLTKMKSLLVCGARLCEVATSLELGEHIRMSRSEAATGGRRRSSILADATEAVLGAVYLDGGLAAAERVVRRWLLDGSEEVLESRGGENYKSRLQEIIQARFKTPPRYRVTSIGGPDHAREFHVSVTFNGHELGHGAGSNKKTAEQDAARRALAELAANDDLLDDLASRPDS
jgi:ribonuclease-3